MEEPVTFSNRRNEQLFGIVHIPERASNPRIGINILNPGLKYRVAPNRLSVKLARSLCNDGYFVMRFDPHGIGDSEGELQPDAHIHELWGLIQKGLFLGDTIASNDMFFKKYGLDRLFLLGNCGGAVTSLLTAAEDSRVGALCLVDLPVTIMDFSRPFSFADKLSPQGKTLDNLFSSYVRKLFQPKYWARLLTGKSDLRALSRVIALELKRPLTSSKLDKENNEDIDMFFRSNRLNPLVFNAFEKFISESKPVLFVLAGNDPGTETFQLYFENRWMQMLSNKRKIEDVEVFVVENANHIYSLAEWQEALIRKICNWVHRTAGGERGCMV